MKTTAVVFCVCVVAGLVATLMGSKGTALVLWVFAGWILMENDGGFDS